MNTFAGTGRMTKDPELRKTSAGKSVTVFSLAIKRKYASSNGQDVDYINCEIWGKGAENTKKYCSKGSLVAITGSLQSKSYENSSGQKVNQTVVVCDSIEFIDTKKKEQTLNQQNQFTQQNMQNDNFGIFPEDIQF